MQGIVEFEGFGGDGFYGGEEAVGIWLWGERRLMRIWLVDWFRRRGERGMRR